MHVTIKILASHDALSLGQDIRYNQGAFDGMIERGKPTPFRCPGFDGEGTLVAAEVVDDGAAANLTFEVDEAVATKLARIEPGLYSVGMLPDNSLAFLPQESRPQFVMSEGTREVLRALSSPRSDLA